MASERSFSKSRNTLSEVDFDRHLRQWDHANVGDAEVKATRRKFWEQLLSLGHDYHQQSSAGMTPEVRQVLQTRRLAWNRDFNLFEYRDFHKRSDNHRLLMTGVAGLSSGVGMASIAVRSNPAVQRSSTFLKTAAFRTAFHVPAMYVATTGCLAIYHKTCPKLLLNSEFQPKMVEYRTASTDEQKRTDALSLVGIVGSYGAFVGTVNNHAVWKTNLRFLSNARAFFAPSTKPVLLGGAIGALCGTMALGCHLLNTLGDKS